VLHLCWLKFGGSFTKSEGGLETDILTIIVKLILLNDPAFSLQRQQLTVILLYPCLLLHDLYFIPYLILADHVLRLVPMIPLIPFVVRPIERLGLVRLIIHEPLQTRV
jgi:hypothetical protein